MGGRALRRRGAMDGFPEKGEQGGGTEGGGAGRRKVGTMPMRHRGGEVSCILSRHWRGRVYRSVRWLFVWHREERRRVDVLACPRALRIPQRQ
jgi:hypothetical protein